MKGTMWRYRARGACAVLIAGLVSAVIIASAGWDAVPSVSARGGSVASGLSEGTPVWTWASGQQITPTVVPEEEATQRLISQVPGVVTRARVPSGLMHVDVTPDGEVIGTRGNAVVAVKGSTLRTVCPDRGWQSVWTSESGVYRSVTSGTSNDATLQLVDLAHGCRDLVRMPGGAGSIGLVHRGRVYWTQNAVDPLAPAAGLTRVVSRDLTGGAVRVEAVSAQNPVMTSQGLVVQALAPREDSPAHATRVIGLDLVPVGGAQRRLLNFHGWADGIAIQSAGMVTTGSGNLLTIASGSTTGLLIIDLATRRSWNVVRKDSDIALATYNTGKRLVWMWSEPFAHGESTPSNGRAGLLVFTPATATLELWRDKSGLEPAGAVGGAMAWFVPDPSAPPASGVGNGEDQPKGTIFASMTGESP